MGNNFDQKWAEAQKLFKEFKVVTFGNKKNLMGMIEQVKPEETLRYADFSNITIIDKQTGEQTAFPGTLFISDQRIYLYQPIPLSKEAHYHEYPFEALRSVSSRGGGLVGGKVKFHTDTQEISFLVSYHPSVVARITEIIDSVIQTAVEVQQGESTEKIAAVDCGGCGVVHVVQYGGSVVCDYCDRALVFPGEHSGQ